jgi:hypothetical protein
MKHKKYLRKQTDGEDVDGRPDSEEGPEEEEEAGELHYIKEEEQGEEGREEQNNNHRGEVYVKGWNF